MLVFWKERNPCWVEPWRIFRVHRQIKTKYCCSDIYIDHLTLRTMTLTSLVSEIHSNFAVSKIPILPAGWEHGPFFGSSCRSLSIWHNQLSLVALYSVSRQLLSKLVSLNLLIPGCYLCQCCISEYLKKRTKILLRFRVPQRSFSAVMLLVAFSLKALKLIPDDQRD